MRGLCRSRSWGGTNHRVERYSTVRSVQPVTAVPAIEQVCTLFCVKTTYEVSFVTYTLPASPVGATAVMVRHPENPASAPTSMLAAMNRLIGSSLSLNGLEHPYRAGMVLQLRADYPQFVHAERSGILRACARAADYCRDLQRLSAQP